MIDWRRVFTPSAWVQLGPVDWEYDKAVNELLDNYGIERKSSFHANIGGLSVWVSNFPYAYGHPSSEPCSPYTMASIKTRKRIKKMLAQADKKKWEK